MRLRYMHKNLVSGKWRLVDDYLDYIHSSAGFYDLGEEGIYKVMHYEEAIKLSSKYDNKIYSSQDYDAWGLYWKAELIRAKRLRRDQEVYHTSGKPSWLHLLRSASYFFIKRILKLFFLTLHHDKLF